MTHLKLQKLQKSWYYSTAHWHLGDVLVGNHFFVIFAVLDVSFAINSYLNRSFVYINVSYDQLLFSGHKVQLDNNPLTISYSKSNIALILSNENSQW